MFVIGIDLGVTGEHKAILVDERGEYASPVLPLKTALGSLERLLGEARRLAGQAELLVIMEPTGMAWYPQAVWWMRQGVRVYLVNSQQVADLRRYYKKHAKSDRIDCRVLARLPWVGMEKLHPLRLGDAKRLGCSRGCKELERLTKQCTAIQNRMIALERFAWPGLEKEVFADRFSPAARWFREHWYNPYTVDQAGAEQIAQQWRASGIDPQDAGDWVVGLVKQAEQVIALYGDAEAGNLDFDRLQAEILREQTQLSFLEQMQRTVRIQVTRPLYRNLHPSRNLESIPGVGEDGAAVYASFIGDAQRFEGVRKLRGWSGMVPNSKQSSDSQSVGLKITQAGPRLIKKFAYLDAEVARLYDPQIAAIYYDQMVHKGKHHRQAVCACATHLLDRILLVLREDRPYRLQDVDGTPLSKPQARQIVQERYKVPEEVRRRNNKRTRRQRVQQQLEKQQERESCAKHDRTAEGFPILVRGRH